MLKLLPIRKSIQLRRPNYLGQQIYFATLCCFAGRSVFKPPARCSWLLELLSKEATSTHFSVHAYCLMPDHLHFLAQGLHAGADFLHFLKSFKVKTSRGYSQEQGQALWQRRFFDHVLRPSDPLESFAWYIWLNPVRRGLASTPEKYPYSGSFSGMKMPLAWAQPQ